MDQEEDRDEHRRHEDPRQSRHGLRARPLGEDAERRTWYRQGGERNRRHKVERAKRIPKAKPCASYLDTERQHRRQEQRQSTGDHVAHAGGGRERR